MCQISGCKAKAVAKGLCAKHYMRARRTGDAETSPRKAGRKPDLIVSLHRETMKSVCWSPRTFSRWMEAMKGMAALGLSAKARQELIQKATRPAGSVNVSMLLDMVVMMI